MHHDLSVMRIGLHGDATIGDKDCRRRGNQDEIPKYRLRNNAGPSGQKDMESSRRYLLQAEIEYWHEMLQLNKSRIPKSKEEEMRVCLKKALRAYNSNPVGEFRAAA